MQQYASFEVALPGEATKTKEGQQGELEKIQEKRKLGTNPVLDMDIPWVP